MAQDDAKQVAQEPKDDAKQVAQEPKDDAKQGEQETGFGGLDFQNLPKNDEPKTSGNGVSMDNLAGALMNLTNIFVHAKNEDSFKRDAVLAYLNSTLKDEKLANFKKEIDSKKTLKLKTFNVNHFLELQKKAGDGDDDATAELITMKLDTKSYSPFETSVTHILQKAEKDGALSRNKDNTTMWVVKDADKLRELIGNYKNPFDAGTEKEAKENTEETEENE